MSSQFQMAHLLYPTEEEVVVVVGGWGPLNNCQLFFPKSFNIRSGTDARS